MKNKQTVLMTGSSGFVGQNIIDLLSHKYLLIPFKLRFKPKQIITIDNANVILHLAGLAHDLNKKSDYINYYESNFELTKQLFDSFLKSNSTTFIYLSSVKAVADKINIVLTEDYIASPSSSYGISKHLAEEYILSKKTPENKNIFILRPCMIYGPGNKGNLNLLYKFLNKNIPWPLGSFNNIRSYCSIENLCFIINELIERDDIPSGIYNIADSSPISTNEIILLISSSQDKKPLILNIPRFLIRFFCKIGDIFNLFFNSDRLEKLTDSYVVSNDKIIHAIKKDLPVDTLNGLIKTFKNFN
jgi:nucleoside-diphosphate-sugar epimerase